MSDRTEAKTPAVVRAADIGVISVDGQSLTLEAPATFSRKRRAPPREPWMSDADWERHSRQEGGEP